MKRIGFFVAVVVLVCAAPGARAQSDDRWGLDLGFFATNFTTTLRLDSEELGLGTEIDLEDDLGMKSDRGDFRLNGFYRFNPRHRIQFGYTRWTRSAEKVLDEEIQWGDEIYQVNARISSELKADWYKLAYKYSFVHNDDVEVGASFGISTYSFSARLAAQVEVEGGQTAEGQVESKSLVAPIPVVGMQVDWRLAPKFTFWFSGEFFDARISGYDGTLTDSIAGFDWMFTKPVGVGVAYNYVSLRVDKDAKADLGVRYSYDGLFAYLKMRF